MQEGTRSEVVRRLRSVEGHVRGVEKMVEEGDAGYADIVQQTSAIFSAIRRRMRSIVPLLMPSPWVKCVQRDRPPRRYPGRGPARLPLDRTIENRAPAVFLHLQQRVYGRRR